MEVEVAIVAGLERGKEAEVCAVVYEKRQIRLACTQRNEDRQQHQGFARGCVGIAPSGAMHGWDEVGKLSVELFHTCTCFPNKITN